jgi:hypothetical protein
MALHKLLVDDFYDDTYSLFGIHCNIEDYRLAYLLNRFLKIDLKRNEKDLDFKYVTASYAIFEWEDKQHHLTWNLVSNICKIEESTLTSSGSLFHNESKIIKTHNLIPEFKNVNYLLKVENDGRPVNEKPILNQLHTVPQIITAYTIDADELKSRENLIFK